MAPPESQSPDPVDVKALYQQAFAFYRQGALEAANAVLADLLAVSPAHSMANLLKGVALGRKAPAVGLALVERGVRLETSNPEAWYNLGVIEEERGNIVDALRAYEQAVLLEPFLADALSNGSGLLRRTERFEEALVWIERYLTLEPESWTGALNKAICLFHFHRFDEAEAWFRRAITGAPDHPIASWEFFPLLLAQKRFAEAWVCYEKRFACGHLNGVFHYPFSHPLWCGEPLEGRRLLLHSEQGLGDQIMYAGILPELVREAAQITLIAAPELVSVFSASFPSVRVLPAQTGRFAGDHPAPGWLDDLGPIDFQLPVGGLPHRRRSTAESFAAPNPYLRPGTSAKRRWTAWAREVLKPAAGLRVGLCWAANPALFRFDTHRRSKRKSMRLEDMAPLAKIPGIQWVSVLNWPIETVPEPFKGKLFDMSSALSSLEETAALIENLDLIVTVDTAVAHLAGAMGKPVWLLLHDFPDARWGFEDDHSYWYADMRLIRQTRAGDWADVIDRVGKDLRRKIGKPPKKTVHD